MESYEKQNEEESCSLFIHQYFFAKKKNLWEKGKKEECCSQINEQNVMANHDIIILSAKKLLC